ncbi:hypothetical protein EX30DRAFT_179097 [Ascodesmis nigricans]|uniref:Uncharacterized protein n=1 Tax=Ascodesmis nigricans TaxID=341454 RepID=A0A4S2MKU0_9PEZI|nr:hypothetical protein EX30DRAFT_179097 [Ascodesmis nigricans]
MAMISDSHNSRAQATPGPILMSSRDCGISAFNPQRSTSISRYLLYTAHIAAPTGPSPRPSPSLSSTLTPTPLTQLESRAPSTHQPNNPTTPPFPHSPYPSSPSIVSPSLPAFTPPSPSLYLPYLLFASFRFPHRQPWTQPEGNLRCGVQVL